MTSCGWDEHRFLDFAKQYLDKTAILLDIGSNIGDFTLEFLNRFPEGRSFCFEPSYSTWRELVNRFVGDNRVIAYNFGIHNEDNDKATFYHSTKQTGLSSIHFRDSEFSDVSKWGIVETTVSLHRLDDVRYLIPNKVDFVKIDTEGNEVFVIESALDFLRTHKPKFIQFEYGGCWIDSRTKRRTVLNILYPKYRIYNMNMQELTYSNCEPDDYYSQNYLAVLSDHYE